MSNVINEHEEKAEDFDEPKIKIIEIDPTKKIPQRSFDDFEALSYELLRGIHTYGFKEPSRIQDLTIEKIHKGTDLVVQSQSGTGKTGAFCIGALTRVDPTLNKPQIVIIANTRELAMQIHSVITELSSYMKLKICLCIGNSSGVRKSDDEEGDAKGSQYNDYKLFNKNVSVSQILVGTPGKLDDLLKRGIIKNKYIKLVILDEADALLKKDFLDQIKSIVTQFSSSTQLCFYSATYSEEIIDLAKVIMPTAEFILMKTENLSLDLIKQYKIMIGHEKYKFDTLLDIYSSILIGQCIIFVNTKYDADNLEKMLANEGHCVGKIHGSMDSKSRCSVLKEFRQGVIRILISTDVLARGIDIQQIGMVINYQLPFKNDEYLHRIGRSGRFGKDGVAINFISNNERQRLKEIEEHYSIEIMDMPEFEEINKQLSGIKGYLEI